jgi:predicted dehydrogenase
MSEEIKIGIVGCGHIAAAHLNGFKELKDKNYLEGVTINALCNPSVWKAESFRKRGEGPAQQSGVGPPDDPMQAPPVWVSDFQDRLPSIYSDYRKMLLEADINTVFVLSPVFTHHEIGLAAVDQGAHLFVEKPFAISVKAGQTLVNAARQKGVTIGVAECVRYLPSVRITRWCIENGYVGDIQFTISVNVGGFWAPDKIIAETGWRHKKLEAGGGLVVDWLVHLLHRLRYTVGEIEEIQGSAKTVEPVRVTRSQNGEIVEQTDCETDDTLSCTIRYGNGALGNIMLSWAGHGGETSLPIVYYGSRGCIKGESIILDGKKPENLRDFFEQRSQANIKEQFMPGGIENFFALEILDFLNAVRGGRDPETSGEEGLRDLACCFAALESSKVNQAVKVQDILDGNIADFEKEINMHYQL